MLRRPATTLQITSEDLAAYESRRVREAHAAQRALREQLAAEAQAQHNHQEQQTPGDEKEERIRRRRDERIGVGRR